MKKIWDFFMKYYNKYKELINYGIFGVLTTAVNYVMYVLCAKLLNIDMLISTFIAWFVSVLFAYVTNKKYVFESKTNKKTEIFREIVSFISFRILSGIIDMIVMYITVDLLELNDLIMKLVSNIIVIILNYVFSKLFIFKKKTDKEES